MANNFDSDSRIIEYWLFENNLTAGKNGNDLNPAAGGVGYESDSPLEGSYSLDLEYANDQWAYRNDVNLSAGFPLKNGDATKKVSWSAWFKTEGISSGYHQPIISKYDGVNNKRSLALTVYNNKLHILWGYNNGASYYVWEIVGITNGRVYHVGMAVDGVAKTALIRLYDSVSETASSYTKSDWGNELNVEDAAFVIGNYGDFPTANYNYDGLVDEVVVADDLLSANEFDLIRQGLFYQLGINNLDHSQVLQTPTMEITSATLIIGDNIHSNYIDNISFTSEINYNSFLIF